MLTRVYLSTATLSKTMEGIDQQVIDTIANDTIAIEHALDSRCSESEDSSDESCSSSDDSRSDDDEELEYEAPACMTGPRRPSLSLNSPSDRRASAPSQRSPLSINSARSLSSSQYRHSIPSPRTPSMSMRHDAALRSFQQKIDQETQISAKSSAKARPAMMNIASLPTVATPRIEIEQVYDDEDEEEMDMAKRDAEMAKADRSAARQRMLTTLGRGGQSSTSESDTSSQRSRSRSRRVPSLDQISDIYHAKLDEVKTPAPKTPGTASPFHHQRNASCPTPTSPYAQQYGEVQVVITPPTPRPQGPSSPALGVYINGLHGNNGFNQYADSTHLVPPAFELAAGKQKARQERERDAGAMAWMATLQAQQQQMEDFCRQQQQVLLSSMQQSLPSCYDVLTSSAGLGLMTNFPSPTIIPGTPNAPSMIHIQQQRAILAQQRAIQDFYLASAAGPRDSSPKSSPPRSNSAKQQPTSASTKSWWRGNSTAPDSSNSIDGASSGSLYSKSSAGVTSANSLADSSPAWRRKGDESPEKIKSAVYLPPAKRAALLKQQQNSRA
jgi:hypothetical protein